MSTYYLERGGLVVKDQRISKLVSLAADKLVSEIVYESKQIASLRQQSHRSAKRRAEKIESLDMEDLEGCLTQLRVFLRRKKRKEGDEK